jgi:alpha-galactosidase
LMGWNSYNYYSCSPSESIMKSNALGLVALGMDKLGYKYVTTDCGWNADYRDASTGQLVWNPSAFPSGGKSLGDYIHGLGLSFGVYSGGGYYQCGSTNEPASLGKSSIPSFFGAEGKLLLTPNVDHETLDANSFASWGADSLK